MSGDTHNTWRRGAEILSVGGGEIELDFVDGKTLTPAATAETEKWAAARLYQRIVVTIALEDCPWPR